MFSHKGTKVTKEKEKTIVSFVPLCETKREGKP